jgi:hypothetical protein
MSYATTKVFPSANCVYVDNDYIALRKQGLLAYYTLYEAVNAWNPGGEAALKFGNPTSTQWGTIILGCGIIQMVPFPNVLPQGTMVEIITEYINIIGQGIDATILQSNGSYFAGATGIRFQTSYFTIQNLTINGDDTTFGNNNLGGFSISPQNGPCNGLIQNVKFYGRANTYSASAISINSNPFVGIIKDCIFDNYFYGGGPQVSFQSATFNGIMDGCRFITPQAGYSILFGNTSHGGSITNCTFSGTPDTCLIYIFDSNYIGEISNCYFYSPTSGIPAIINTEFAQGNASRCMISDCTFEMQGTCLSGIFNSAARIYNCYMRTEQGDQSCIKMYPTTNGFPSTISIFGSRLIGAGTGLALEAVHTGTAPCVLAGNYMRMPNGDVAGTAISNQITNVASTPFNTELPSSLTI